MIGLFISSCSSRWQWLTSFLLIFLLAIPGYSRHPVVARLDNDQPLKVFKVINGSIKKIKGQDGKVIRWQINNGQTSKLELRREYPVFDSLRYFDRFDFDFKIVSGCINELSIEALGHISGERQCKVHQWTAAIKTTAKQVWHHRQLRLNAPNWFPWADKDGYGTDSFFYFQAAALEPDTVIEIRNSVFTRGVISLKPDYEWPVTWPMRRKNDDGSFTYKLEYRVLNCSGQPLTVTAKILSQHRYFKVTISPEKQDIRSEHNAVFHLTATISAAAIKKTPELYKEPLKVEFIPSIYSDAVCLWYGNLVRPLGQSVKNQVIVPDSDLKKVRAMVRNHDKKALKALELNKILRVADEFLKKRFDMLPGPSGHVANGYPAVMVNGVRTQLLPGSFCPEAVSRDGSYREVGTPAANRVWKEYFSIIGNALEYTGRAYALTGDEKYAKKAIEVLKTYAQHYKYLRWNTKMYDVPWNRSNPILCSGKFAASSTYGDNWYMKGMCRMASLIADSPSWKPDDREYVYQEFIVPFATSIAKFVGGISNMTDITNHDLLLLGLAFDDATMVDFALNSDPGTITRLVDIDPDGFSAEGRPINYQFAGMNEYLPSLIYLRNSGLKVHFPAKRLLKAFQMPYLRAALNGRIPSTGDCGRGQGIGAPGWTAEYVYAFFPDQTWLLPRNRAGSFQQKINMLLRPVKINPQAWRKQFSSKPILFKYSGMAILRTGDTVQKQIMVTLDYGRNMFHAHLDRNQLTLSAFGLIFTHGTGSLYNAGSGGITKSADRKLQSFCYGGTLGQNVVVIDEKDQLPAVGKLLFWSDQPNYQVAVSEVDGLAPGVKYIRAIVLSEGIVVVIDSLSSDKEHKYDFVYHNFGTLTADNDWHSVPVNKPLAKTGNYQNLEQLQKLTGQSPLRLTWDLSNQLSARNKKLSEPGKTAAIFLNFFQPVDPETKVYTAVTGMNNPKTGMVPDATQTVITRKKGKKAVFLTVLEPCRGKSKIESVNRQSPEKISIKLKNGKKITVDLAELLNGKI